MLNTSRTPTSTFSKAVIVCAVLLTLAGCKSDAQKRDEARIRAENSANRIALVDAKAANRRRAQDKRQRHEAEQLRLKIAREAETERHRINLADETRKIAIATEARSQQLIKELEEATKQKNALEAAKTNRLTAEAAAVTKRFQAAEQAKTDQKKAEYFTAMTIKIASVVAMLAGIIVILIGLYKAYSMTIREYARVANIRNLSNPDNGLPVKTRAKLIELVSEPINPPALLTYKPAQ